MTIEGADVLNRSMDKHDSLRSVRHPYVTSHPLTQISQISFLTSVSAAKHTAFEFLFRLEPIVHVTA
ncbi:MAG TPA: hypothetical protein VMQ17_26220 [Candidatus Sulfotelmatobacter sp.]|nr:hypothetical protein [Candidatus Sulfotelmatobacter sp.]